ncbi:hypothetical protein PTTG_28834 [Puccinia triticina 1-1 BBBD Race 1]|uniref:RING-type domain-containing protein n=1 Tax=Puccinia triticina (isolate 1-1 / race 1 (BBBD)) TaxID=630390 RepID=A0A180GAY0_PUCT1|nr:hypothetical protein PTTG_28834 [Puccinia triticina 1-1 BBBD Race 1]
MDPNSHPTDSERAEDQPGQSPGGIRPVEEPAERLPSPPTEPEANAQQDEEIVALEYRLPPHAVPGEEVHLIELPAELNDQYQALFGRLRDGPVVIHVGDDGVARIQDDDGMDVVVAEETLAFLRQIEELPEVANEQPAHDYRSRAWEQFMETLSPEHQVMFQNVGDATHRLIEAIGEDPNRAGLSSDEINQLRNNMAEVERNAANFPTASLELFIEWFAEADEEIARRLRTPAQMANARRAVNTLLNNLPNTDRAALVTDDLDNSSPQCTVCLEDYVEGDVIVVLPCHPSHHFHRVCIHDWLQALIPHPYTCPNCRASILLRMPTLAPQ